jgi:RNA polymerase sigma-70 factor (ECF subfamily)
MNIQEIEDALAHREKSASTDEGGLVTEAKCGASCAFGELYERHRLRIYRSALRILRNRQDAEDAVQRAFQRAFTHLNGFRENSTFSTWVTRIAINEALMLLRQRHVTTHLSETCNDNMKAISTLDLADERPVPE